jgi:hypothetical protein
VLIQAKGIDRFDDDLIIYGIDGKARSRLPHGRDRQFHLFIDVAF